MTGKVNFRTTIKSDLGDTLFPGEDFYSRELNSLVGEVVEDCIRLDKPLSLTGIGETLGVMTPQFLLDSIWDERDKERWQNELKPKLISAFEEFFINGGFEDRSAEISNLLTSLNELGIEITRIEKLKASLLLGDWRNKLVCWAEMGRPEGVIFTRKKGTPLEAVVMLLQQYQFPQNAIDRFMQGGLRSQN